MLDHRTVNTYVLGFFLKAKNRTLALPSHWVRMRLGSGDCQVFPILKFPGLSQASPPISTMLNTTLLLQIVLTALLHGLDFIKLVLFVPPK